MQRQRIQAPLLRVTRPLLRRQETDLLLFNSATRLLRSPNHQEMRMQHANLVLLRQSETDLLLRHSKDVLLRRPEDGLLLCRKEMLLRRAGAQSQDCVRLWQGLCLLLVR